MASNSTCYAVHIGNFVDEIGVVLTKSKLHIKLNFALLSGLALDNASFGILFEMCLCLGFRIVIFAADNGNVGCAVRFSVYENQQDNADNDASYDRQRYQSRSEDNSRIDGSAEERNIQRFLDSRAETDDRQRTDHTERKHHIARYRQNNDGGYHSQRHQSNAEA